MTLNVSTNLELVTHFQEEKEMAYFGELYKRFFPKIFTHANYKLRDREQAFEFTTNYFVSLAMKITNMEDPQQILSFLEEYCLTKEIV